MLTCEYFNFARIANRLGVTPEVLEEAFARVLEDYRGDRMLAELRMLRTCRALERGHGTVADLITGCGAAGVAEESPAYGHENPPPAK